MASPEDADPTGGTAGSPLARLLSQILALRASLFFGLASLLLVGPHVLPPTRIAELSYDAPDALIHLWNFWWTKVWVVELANPYFTKLLFHPFGTSLAVHGYALPYSLALVPVQWALPGTVGLVVSYNLVVFASFVLSGVGAYRLALLVTGHHRGSLVAGIVFAFTPFHFLNMARFNILCIEFIPFYVHALLSLWATPTRKGALALAAWLALCLYTSLEYTLYLALLSLVWLLFVAASDRARLDRTRLVAFAQAGVLFLVVASPLLLQQAATRANAGTVPIERPIEEIVHYSPALLSFVTPSRVHPVYGNAFRFAGEYPDRSRWGMRSETSIGLLTWILVAIAVAGARRGGRGLWIVVSSLFFVLTLGPQLRVSGTWLTDVTLPYRWLYEIFPPLRGGRDPTRIFPVALLGLAILAAFGTRDLLERVTDGRRLAVAAAIVGLLLFESLTLLRPKFAPALPEIYRELAADPERGPIVDLTPTLFGMLGQTEHGRPIGYAFGIALRAAPTLDRFEMESRFGQPRRTLELPTSERTRALASLRDEVRARGLTTLVFPASPIAGNQRRLASMLGAPVSSRGGYFSADLRPLRAGSAPR